MQQDDKSVVRVSRSDGQSPVVLVCEHASLHIPAELNGLGLDEAARRSHAAWDIGALGVAKAMSRRLDAALVASAVSRLAYDCNRPPEAPDAIPAESEVFAIPGNADLTPAERRRRIEAYYEPFRDALAAETARRVDPVIVTIHSFTPVYHGVARAVEIGVLHDADSRLADAMLDVVKLADAKLDVADRYVVQRNAPYGPEDGVTHTLKLHALPAGRLNVMIEIRNDLIRSEAAQQAMAGTLSAWLATALDRLGISACRV